MIPSSAVASILMMVVGPVSAIGLEKVLRATVAPFTVTVAFGSSLLGFTMIIVALEATDVL